MSGAFVRILDNLRQPGVQLTPLGGRYLGVDDRSEQRVGKGDPIACHLQDSRVGPFGSYFAAGTSAVLRAIDTRSWLSASVTVIL